MKCVMKQNGSSAWALVWEALRYGSIERKRNPSSKKFKNAKKKKHYYFFFFTMNTVTHFLCVGQS